MRPANGSSWISSKAFGALQAALLQQTGLRADDEFRGALPLKQRNDTEYRAGADA